MRKAKKKRKDESEQDSDSKLDPTRVWRHAQASRRHRVMSSPSRQGSGGGRSPPGGAFIHHNFRYGPEPPAYKTPKPEYPSYTRRDPEKHPVTDRHVVKSSDDKFFQRFMRRIWKEQSENDFVVRNFPEIVDEFPELKQEVKINQSPEVTTKDLDEATRIPRKTFTQTELEPFIQQIEKKTEQPKKPEFDPELLIKQLEVYPTEDLRDKTLAGLNNEPEFHEEEVEGCKVETNRVTAVEPTPRQIEQHSAEIQPYAVAPHAEKSEVDLAPEQNPAIVHSEIGPISETEIFSDVQDLMHELEPEIEEQEEVEPSY